MRIKNYITDHYSLQKALLHYLNKISQNSTFNKLKKNRHILLAFCSSAAFAAHPSSPPSQKMMYAMLPLTLTTKSLPMGNLRRMQITY